MGRQCAQAKVLETNGIAVYLKVAAKVKAEKNTGFTFRYCFLNILD